WRRVSHASAHDAVDTKELAKAFNTLTVATLPDSYHINEFWNITPGTNISTLLGLDRILLVLETPWSHFITQPLAAYWSVLNMTVAVVLNTADVFSPSSNVRAYFQFGHLRERAFLSVSAITDLLVYFDVSIPCPFASIGHMMVSVPFISLEFFIGWLFAL